VKTLVSIAELLGVLAIAVSLWDILRRVAGAKLATAIFAIAFVALLWWLPHSAVRFETLGMGQNADMVLKVTNIGTDDWEHVVVSLNDHFEYGVRQLKAGGVVQLDTTEFTNKNGERFNPWTMKVRIASVTASQSLFIRIVFDNEAPAREHPENR
jgi:hypothetical protein